MVLEAQQQEGPSKSDLVELLDKEIAVLTQDESRVGTSAWTLVAAMGALAFVSLGEWEAHTIQLDIYCKALTVGCFVIYPLIGWFWEAGAIVQLHRDPTRSRPASQALHTHRVPLLVLLAMSPVVLWATYRGSRGVGLLAVGLAEAAVAITSGLLVTVLVMSLFDLDVPGTARAKPNRALATVWTLLSVWILVVVVGYAHPVRLADWKLHGAEIRLAGYSIAAGVLLRLLSALTHRDPTLWELARLRRDLLLGRIELGVARRQIEIALMGLDSAARVERKLQEAIAAHNAALAAIQALETLVVRTVDAGPAPKHGATAVKVSATRSIRRAQKATRKALRRSFRAFRSLKKQPLSDLQPSGQSLYSELRQERSVLYQRYAMDRFLIRQQA